MIFLNTNIIILKETKELLYNITYENVIESRCLLYSQMS